MKLRLLAVSLLAGCVSYVALPASVAQVVDVCDPTNRVIGDFDSDGVADLAVGDYFFNGERGAVDVFFADGDTEQITATSLGFGTPATGSWFGNTVVAHDLDADGCDDLVIGSPGFDTGSGRVYVAWGHADGSFTAGPVLEHAEEGAYFGATLALTAPTKGPTATTDVRLFVGAPNADTAGKTDAGAVEVFSMSLGQDTWTVGPVLSQNSAKMQDTAEPSDQFGRHLAAWGNTLLVHASGENVGDEETAGVVHVIKLSGANPTTVVKDTVTHQNKPGVGDSAQSFEGFGNSLAIMGTKIAIGIPSEDNSSGAVQIYDWRVKSATLTPLTLLNQNSAGVPDKKKAGNTFAWALAWNKDAISKDTQALLVSAPYFDSPDLNDIGVAYALELNKAGTVMRSKKLSSPEPQAGARFGVALAPLRGIARDGVAISAPLYDDGATSDVGQVWWGRPIFDAPTEKQALSGLIASNLYGYFLCQPGSN